MIENITHSNMLVSPARSIEGVVELYNGSTLLNTFKHTDALSSFTISRAGDTKFFGFGVCQEIEVKLVDKERAIDIVKNQIIKIAFKVNNNTVYPAPPFYISEVTRDENTNELTIKGFDAIHKMKSHTIAELELEAPYMIEDILNKIASLFGVWFGIYVEDRSAFSVIYPEGANFEGTETIREVLDDIAEATQTIYYMDYFNTLAFRRLEYMYEPVVTINKADYFTLESKTNRILSDICSATELGDNIITSTGKEGETQYVRDNAFWELNENITTVLDDAIALVGGTSIHQFNCKWRGNYLLEPGDKIAIITKDDNTIISYLFNDKYTYNGGLSADTSWDYGEKNGESTDNPVTLGETLKKTYAKVDKANKQIEIVAGETTAIKMTTDSIQASVANITDDVDMLSKEVSAKMSEEDVTILIKSSINEGADSITTTTGFTFNEDGLNISKSDNEINTQITEDGMSIYRNNDEILVANNLGVQAEDLHATTFLIIGNNSRFEDYNKNRTGCFWIGN